MVRLLQGDLPQRDLNELRRRAVPPDHPSDLLRVDGVEVLVDLIEEVERRGVVFLDCEDEGHRGEGFLPAGQGLEPQCLFVRRLHLQDEPGLERFLRVFQKEVGFASFAQLGVDPLEVLADRGEDLREALFLLVRELVYEVDELLALPLEAFEFIL